MTKKLYVKICPKCKKGNIQREAHGTVMDAFGMPSPYKCLDCGFSSHIFPEIDVDELSELK